MKKVINQQKVITKLENEITQQKEMNLKQEEIIAKQEEAIMKQEEAINNAKLNQTVEMLSQDNAKMNQANAQMNATIGDQAREILALQQKMTQDTAKMNSTIIGISQTNTDRAREILGLQQKMTQDTAKINSTITGISQTNTDQAREILGLQQICNNLTSQVNYSLTQVFFSAALTAAKDTTTVIYDKVWSNVGSAYDATTGVFTCTVAGYYSFVTNVMSQEDKDAALVLKHNYNKVYLVYTYRGKGKESATNSAIIKLNKGDIVRVEYFHSFSLVFANDRNLVTSFSGQLISVV